MKSYTRGLRCFAVLTVVLAYLAVPAILTLPAYGYEVVGWGELKLPNTPLTNLTKIAAGGYHSLALKSDGSIVGWGADWYGQLTPPAGNNFIAIVAGESYNLALKSDGSIVGWGCNLYGQATPPAGNNYVAIDTGYEHSLALKSDGSIVGWGYNEYGQATPPTGNDFIAIAAGRVHSLALKSDGSIVGWGYNGDGQATPPTGNDFIAIAAGCYHSLALKSDGSIVGWGDNSFGQNTPPAGNDFIAITASISYSLALKSDGSIVGWGQIETTPFTGNDFVAIVAGANHSLALKSDGSIVGWGNNEFGQTTPPTGNNYVAIAAGSGYSIALRQVVQTGDLNNDYKVDYSDLEILTKQWLQHPGNPPADLNKDGIVNFYDYAVIAENWTGKIVPPLPMADYYVDPNGNDSNPGISPEQAWKTIQKAVDTAQAGKTILVMPGTYAEQVLTANAGTSGNPITYRAWYEKGQVIINATGKTFGFKNTKAYIILDGFEVINANQNGILFTNDSGDNCIIRNCVSHNNGTNGIRIDGPDNCLIQNCLIYDNSTNGIELLSNSDGTYVNNCTIYGNGDDGVSFNLSDGTVNDSIIVGNGQWGLSSYGGMTANVYYSDIWNNINGHYDNTSKIIEGGNCIHSDPMFIEPSSGDFNLQSDSPCKNTASDVGDMGYRYSNYAP